MVFSQLVMPVLCCAVLGHGGGKTDFGIESFATESVHDKVHDKVQDKVHDNNHDKVHDKFHDKAHDKVGQDWLIHRMAIRMVCFHALVIL